MSDKEKNGFIEYLKEHKGVVIGMCVGFFVGGLILSIGFFRTLFLAICVGIGAFFGSNNQFKKKIRDALDRVLPNIFK